MKYFVLVLWLFSFVAQADYRYEGELQLQLLNGEQHTQVFPLALTREAGSYLFQVGAQNVRLPAPPQKYALSLILQAEREVWVTDFISQPLQGFSLNIAEYKISLRKDPEARTARGNYVLTFNDEVFYFSRGPAQINFNFNNNGIAEIEIRGMFKPRR